MQVVNMQSGNLAFEKRYSRLVFLPPYVFFLHLYVLFFSHSFIFLFLYLSMSITIDHSVNNYWTIRFFP